VRRGEFRDDLYYRLNVVPLRLPPLRQRREDIPQLLEFLLETHAAKLGVELPEVSLKASRALHNHDWPGNVRELDNRVQRALLLCQTKQLQPRDFFDCSSNALDQEQQVAFEFGDCSRSLAEIEQAYIGRVMEKTDGNQSRAAEILRITRKTLRNKLQAYSATTDTPESLRSVS
jgi:DNA-binding NtrC family response regulator